MEYGNPAQAAEFVRIIEERAMLKAILQRCERLRKVAQAAESYGMENDIGDECYEALDALHPGDLNDNIR